MFNDNNVHTLLHQRRIFKWNVNFFPNSTFLTQKSHFHCEFLQHFTFLSIFLDDSCIYVNFTRITTVFSIRRFDCFEFVLFCQTIFGTYIISVFLVNNFRLPLCQLKCYLLFVDWCILNIIIAAFHSCAFPIFFCTYPIRGVFQYFQFCLNRSVWCDFIWRFIFFLSEQFCYCDKKTLKKEWSFTWKKLFF